MSRANINIEAFLSNANNSCRLPWFTFPSNHGPSVVTLVNGRAWHAIGPDRCPTIAGPHTGRAILYFLGPVTRCQLVRRFTGSQFYCYHLTLCRAKQTNIVIGAKLNAFNDRDQIDSKFWPGKSRSRFRDWLRRKYWPIKQSTIIQFGPKCACNFKSCAQQGTLAIKEYLDCELWPISGYWEGRILCQGELDVGRDWPLCTTTGVQSAIGQSVYCLPWKPCVMHSKQRPQRELFPSRWVFFFLWP